MVMVGVKLVLLVQVGVDLCVCVILSLCRSYLFDEMCVWRGERKGWVLWLM